MDKNFGKKLSENLKSQD
jgi:hypothetical protein